MDSPSTPTKPPGIVAEYGLVDLAALLLRDQNIHQGHYAVSVKFTFNIGTMIVAPGVPPGPAIAASVQGIALAEAKPGDAGAVDAAIVNPAPAPVGRLVGPKTRAKPKP